MSLNGAMEEGGEVSKLAVTFTGEEIAEAKQKEIKDKAGIELLIDKLIKDWDECDLDIKFETICDLVEEGYLKNKSL